MAVDGRDALHGGRARGPEAPVVCVLGATGLVGRAMLVCLEERGFPLARLVLLASRAAAGTALRFAGREVRVEEALPGRLDGVDLVLASAGREASLALLPLALERGATCVDNSSAFRLSPEVPLVVPEVNGALLDARPPLVANPNCSTIQLVCALAPLHAAAGLRRVVVATYQSASGAGRRGLAALEGADPAPGEPPSVRPADAVPRIGELDEEDATTEEAKLAAETPKILGAPVAVHALCVRVPTRVGHGEAVFVETERPLDPDEACRLLDAAPGVVCDGRRGFATPREVEGTDAVRVGRVRRAGDGLSFWVAADNLRKGAALNAVQIAERLSGYSAPRNG